MMGAHVGSTVRLAWRFVVCPLKKLVFPVRDLRTGIKQSRMRYYRVQFRYRNGCEQIAFQQVNSSGHLTGYFGFDGKRYIPEEPQDCSVLDAGEFDLPTWGRIDWSDIFNADKDSGCWGISER